MQLLRANTAVDVLIGPFIDDTDGKTAETGLTITQADVRLSKLGQDIAQKNDANAAAHDELGYHNCPLDATDTNTEGTLVLMVHESGALPIRHEYMVLAEAAWDSLFAAKDAGFMDVNIKTIGRADTQETEANNLESACANYSATRGLTGTAVPAVAADGAGGLPISDAGGLDLDALYTECVTRSNIVLTGTASAGSATTITLTGGVASAGYYNGAIVVILSGTGIGQTRTILSYAANTVATVTRDWVTAPDATSVFIVLGGDWPAILEAGTAQAGAAATITLDAAASATSSIYIGNHIMITAGTGIGQTRLISAYNGGTKVATITPTWTTNPDATSVYQIMPMARVDVSKVAGTLQTAGDLAALITTVDTVVDSILADTGTDGVVLAADAITSAKIADDAIAAEHIASAAIVADSFAAGAINAAAIAADAIDADALAADAVTEISAKVGAGSGISMLLMLDRIYMRLAHEVNITDADGSVAIRNAGDTADIGTSSITDDDTTTSQAMFAWT